MIPGRPKIFNLQKFKKMAKFDLVNEIKISYTKKGNSDVVINGSARAAEIFRAHMGDQVEYTESFWVLCLSQANKVLGIKKIADGGLTQCLVDLKVLFQTALKANAAAIIVCHNHPSGNLTASGEDIHLTERIKRVGADLTIRLLDHVIITEESYTSLADEGYI